MNDSSTCTFGPEWLSFSPSSPTSLSPTQFPSSVSPFSSSQDYEREGGGGGSISYQSSPRAGRFNSSPKSRGYLKFQKSKSTTQIFENAPELDTRNDVFAMLKERNTFDRNFPTLNSRHSPKSTTPNTATPPIGSPREKESVWSNHSSSAPSTTSTPRSTVKPSSSSSSSNSSACSSFDDHSKNIDLVAEHLRNLVPPSSTAKVILRTNRPEISIPTKKTGIPINLNPKPIMPPKAFGNFRKASSEPTLPLSPAYEEKYAKLLATKKLPAEKVKENMIKENLAQAASQLAYLAAQTNTPTSGDQSPSSNSKTSDSPEINSSKPRQSSVSDRQDFFLNLLNQEAEKKKKESGDIVEGESFKPHTPSNDDHNNTKNKQVSEEDEERFLRGLGWVPEEESHVPELTSEEISQLKFQSRMQPKTKSVAFCQNAKPASDITSNVMSSFSNEDKDWDEIFGSNGEIIETC